MKFIQTIDKHLAQICKQADEFAYLSMTGKIENTVRDKLAFSLHKELKNEYFVLREYKGEGFTDRTDIAILDKNDKIVCLIELKARSLPGIDREFIKFLEKDCLKMENKSKDSENISIVIFNNIIDLDLDYETKHLRYYKQNHLKHLQHLSSKIDKDHTRIVAETNLIPSDIIKIDSGNYFNAKIENIIYTYSNESGR